MYITTRDKATNRFNSIRIISYLGIQKKKKKSNKWVTKKIIHLHHSIFWIRLLSINNNINVDNV